MINIKRTNIQRMHVLGEYIIAALIIILVHVFLLSYMSRSEIKSDLENDAVIGARLASDKVGDYAVLAEHAAIELGNIESNYSVNSLIIMDSFVKNNKFDEVYLFNTKGKMYRHNGQEIPLSPESFEQITNEDYNDNIVLIKDVTDQDNKKLMVVDEIVNHRKTIGYFAGCFDIEKIFPETIQEYLELPAGAYIVGDDGAIVAQSNSKLLGDEFADLDNLLVYFDGTDAIDEQKTELKRRIINSDDGDMQINADGVEYGLIFRAIPNMSGYLYVTILPKSDYLGELLGQRKVEAFLIIFDLVAILIGIAVVRYLYKKREKNLQEIAYLDTVTSAYTKAYLREMGQRLLDEEDIPYAVAALDIVGFRYVNELFGHERGDEILRFLADRVKGWLGSKEILSRNTADFFELIIADPTAFEVKMGLLSEAINEYARGIDVTYPIKIRAGYVKTSKTNRDLYELLDRANAARKTIDEKSSEMVVEYNREMQDELKRKDEISAAKESAMEHGEFKVFLQPKFDVKTGKLAGAEALIRWIRRDGSMVFPDEFIPVFESDGFIEQVDFFMLESVCKLLVRLGEEGYQRVPISVNQSRVLLLNPEYISLVLDIFEKYDVPKKLLELELTETTFFDDQDRMISIMTKLREEGCIIDIDDFGSGYSSLNMIKDIPFDILKIDRGFFGEINNEKGVIILERVVDMASSIGVKCVCEGVETKEQEQLLRDIGCAYAQGYLYSKPIPADEFVEKFMTKENE